MSLIKSILHQLGLSSDPTKNFTLGVPAVPDGTMKLARGNAGATTQDIMTVDAAGKVAFPQMSQDFSSNGYIKLPGGLIIQWGNGTTDSGGGLTFLFPISFPNVCRTLQISSLASATTFIGLATFDNNGATITARELASGAGSGAGKQFFWLAIGY